jgi:hypothetical protein
LRIDLQGSIAKHFCLFVALFGLKVEPCESGVDVEDDIEFAEFGLVCELLVGLLAADAFDGVGKDLDGFGVFFWVRKTYSL